MNAPGWVFASNVIIRSVAGHGQKLAGKALRVKEFFLVGEGDFW
jgi:hypothetical protein